MLHLILCYYIFELNYLSDEHSDCLVFWGRIIQGKIERKIKDRTRFLGDYNLQQSPIVGYQIFCL